MPNYQNGAKGKTQKPLQQFREITVWSWLAQIIYDDCHHNIIYGSLNLNIPLPPPYYRGVSNYKNTDPICIQRTVLVNWNDVFNKKTADEKVKSVNNILLNIFRNLIPHEIIKFDYKNPNWINPKVFIPEKYV